jgi:hypothetical protein
LLFGKTVIFKRPNLLFIGIEEEEEVQTKSICSIFNKTIAENFLNLKKEIPIQVQEAISTPKKHDQNRTTPCHIVVKTISTENRKEY